MNSVTGAANVTVLQGISLAGEDLIITFNVEEGPLTRVAETEVRGATVFEQDRLRKKSRS